MADARNCDMEAILAPQNLEIWNDAC